MEFRNHTKDKSEWEIEDGMDGLIEANQGHHPKLDTEFPRVILEIKIPDPKDSMEAKSINENFISADNSGIIHNPGVCDNNGTPNHIFTPLNNKTPDVDEESDDNDGDDDDNS